MIRVIGAGLAGCEAAWYLARHGEEVELVEQKPVRRSPAHSSDGLCELVCSNSLKSDDVFGNACGKTRKALSPASLDLIIINTAVPMLFAYGRHRRDDALTTRALDIITALKPERNHIVRLWERCGLKAESAADSQALIQLRREYCDRKDCLRCRIGYEFLKNRNGK